jgi:hypothetical protein
LFYALLAIALFWPFLAIFHAILFFMTWFFSMLAGLKRHSKTL